MSLDGPPAEPKKKRMHKIKRLTVSPNSDCDRQGSLNIKPQVQTGCGTCAGRPIFRRSVNPGCGNCVWCCPLFSRSENLFDVSPGPRLSDWSIPMPLGEWPALKLPQHDNSDQTIADSYAGMSEPPPKDGEDNSDQPIADSHARTSERPPKDGE